MEQVRSSIISIFLCLLLLVSCAHKTDLLEIPPPFEPELTQEIPPYEPQVPKLEKVGRPEKILLTADFKPTEDPTKAKYVAYETKEYAKIVAHFKREQSLEEIATKLEELVNENIITMNGMQKILSMEREMRRLQTEMTNYQIQIANQSQSQLSWLKAENAFLKVFIVAGTIIIAIAAM